MGFLYNLYTFFNTQMEKPESFGSYHMLCIGILLVFTVVFIALFKKASDKTVRGLACFFWVTLVVLEIIKQVLFSINDLGGALIWEYKWYTFPFQLCSSPLYLLPFVAFCKNEKVRNTAIVFLITFSFFGGACVYVFPNDVFAYRVFTNVQTMVHHGVQLAFGAYLAFRYKNLLTFKNLVRATGLFIIFLAIAMGLNLGSNAIFPSYGIDQVMNMFYISPYIPCTLPVLSMIYPLVSYPVFLCVYVFGFMLCAGLVMLLMKGLTKLFRIK